VEVSYRFYLYNKYVDGKYGIVIVSDYFNDPDSPGLYKQNLNIKWMQFDGNHNLLRMNRIITNNQGYVSENDYSFLKPSGEYRIAIIGDSLTACVTNDFPWPDILEKILNKDNNLKILLDIKNFKVLNFGVQGAGFENFAQIYNNKVIKYCPDLIIVNFIEDDFRRMSIQKSKTDAGPSSKSDPYINIDGIKIRMLCKSGPVSLDNPECVPSYEFIVKDSELAFDKEKVIRVKRFVAKQFFHNKLIFSLYPYAFERIVLKRGFGYQRYWRKPGEKSNIVDDITFVEKGIESIRAIRNGQYPLLVVHSPSNLELHNRTRPPLVIEAMKRDKDLKIVFMADYFPEQKDIKEISKLYNLPHDGHWSNLGATKYAEAVHKMLKDYFMSNLPKN
jgi:hypothetical protein